MKRIASIIILGIITVYLGFLRDGLFKSINFEIYHQYYNTDFSYALPQYELVLSQLTVTQLETLKWSLTITTTLLFFGITVIGLRLLFRTFKYTKTVSIVYVTLFFGAGAFYLIGKLIGEYESGYHFARLLMGALQSPFILLFLIPSVKLMDK